MHRTQFKNAPGLKTFATGGLLALAAAGILGVTIAHAFNGATRLERDDQQSRVVIGTVQSTGTQTFTVLAKNGTLYTVNTTTLTVYRETGDPSPISGVAGGERVAVWSAKTGADEDSTNPAPTTLTATNVVVLLAGDAGWVSSVNGSTVTLLQWFHWFHSAPVFDTTSSTLYFQDGQPATASAVTPNEFVAAFGTRAGGGTLTAQFVNVFTKDKDGDKDKNAQTPITPLTFRAPAAQTAATSTGSTVVTGVVQSVSGDTIIVKTKDGGTETVLTTAATVFNVGCDRSGSSQPTTIAQVQPREFIKAAGTSTSAGTLTATTVDISGGRNGWQWNGGGWNDPDRNHNGGGGSGGGGGWGGPGPGRH
ncbi:MAG: hypothetical protein JOY68_01350 [Candidatus Dormibacteraeota bacterium]|nr:hypothetical protein [Candidatus Dormibacteraeota bacterium]